MGLSQDVVVDAIQQIQFIAAQAGQHIQVVISHAMNVTAEPRQRARANAAEMLERARPAINEARERMQAIATGTGQSIQAALADLEPVLANLSMVTTTAKTIQQIQATASDAGLEIV